MKRVTWTLTLAVLAACTPHNDDTRDAAPASLTGLSRDIFNARARELALPLFWTADDNRNGALDPQELAVVWGMEGSAGARWVRPGGFTPATLEAFERMKKGAEAPAGPEEAARRAALDEELAQSYFTLIESDFRTASEEDRTVVAHVQEAASIVERIHAKQRGTFGLAEALPEDGLSHFVYFLNQGPWCSGPATENDPACTALPNRPEKASGLYPAALQQKEGFCDALAQEPNAAALLSPFTVVVERDGKLDAVPYNEFYRDDMQHVARELRAAARAIASPGEASFKAYLLAAAQAFTDNQWFLADEAWSKMNAENSKWYLRIGPDEVYFEPCARKAGFHVSFARINPSSLEWQRKLDPLKQDMERAMAQKAGKPYQAREVHFHLPDFIDIVLNAGDSRAPRGGTIGQSLPNWGPVANEGRGRTVVMANLYQDADSRQIARRQAETLLCKDTMAAYREEAGPQLMTTVLHEAGHNLGPSHEYQVGGKTDDEIFGGPLASTLEELKAQTQALFFTDWLAAKGVIDQKTANEAHLRDITWAFGHISRGMVDAEGRPKPYSQLASMQMGFLMQKGALAWRPDEPAANRVDTGCFAVDFARLPGAIDELTTLVLGIKGRGDRVRAEALKAELVDAEGAWKDLRGIIRERWLRLPRASFLYSVKL